ncbi:Protein of unknown function [Pyronema omphalodes CBS 100304]|uniref:Uncharacterized protein n=1 Tax=Pyronema omphalodes (strain CBS 100304) TaxID=1076935 RepID=U4L9Z8_PYROM|nr:Protein of unknown function [Pyronema omphalodes CBS 100304]
MSKPLKTPCLGIWTFDRWILGSHSRGSNSRLQDRLFSGSIFGEVKRKP